MADTIDASGDLPDLFSALWRDRHRHRRTADKNHRRSRQPDVQGLHLRQGAGASGDSQQPGATAEQSEARRRRDLCARRGTAGDGRDRGEARLVDRPSTGRARWPCIWAPTVCRIQRRPSWPTRSSVPSSRRCSSPPTRSTSPASRSPWRHTDIGLAVTSASTPPTAGCSSARIRWCPRRSAFPARTPHCT